MTTSDTRIKRYRNQSLNLLQTAFLELRQGRWSRSEELLWGSLTLAVKGAALSRGDVLQDQDEIQAYALALGRERRDRRIREAFNQLSNFSDATERVRDSRYRVDHLGFGQGDLPVSGLMTAVNVPMLPPAHGFGNKGRRWPPTFQHRR